MRRESKSALITIIEGKPDKAKHEDFRADSISGMSLADFKAPTRKLTGKELRQLKELFIELMDGVADRHDRLNGKGLKAMFQKCGFKDKHNDLEVFMEDLEMYKGDSIHFTELLEYMGESGLSDLLEEGDVEDMYSSLMTLEANDETNDLTLKQETLEWALLNYLPDHIHDKSEIRSILEHLDPKFFSDGVLDYGRYFQQLVRKDIFQTE